MKIIQTFWTAGQDPLKHGFGWTHPEYNLMSWALSCLSLREHYDEVELYTDSVGYHILIEVLQLPYTKTHVIFDDFKCLPHHWALSKIKTYSLQTEPFLHIDGDIYLPKPLPERILNSPLVAQNKEMGTIYYRCMMDKGILQYHNVSFPTYLENGLKERSIASYNMGIFGGNDISSIKTYCKEVFHFFEDNKMNDISVPQAQVNCNVLFEQIFFALWAEHHNHDVENIIEHKIKDNGYTFNDFCNLNNYEQKALFHILGGHKKSSRILSMLVQTLLSKYPQYYLQIISLFPKLHKRFSNKNDYNFVSIYPPSFNNILGEIKDMLENIPHEDLLSWEETLIKTTINIKAIDPKVNVKCIPWIKVLSLDQKIDSNTEKIIRLKIGIGQNIPLEHIAFIPTLKGDGYKEVAINNISLTIISQLTKKDTPIQNIFEFLAKKYNLTKDMDKKAIKIITYNEIYKLHKLELLTFY